MSVEILSFSIAGRTYGLPISSVREVLRAVSLTPPPEASSQLEGLVNVRGQVVPVVDVRTALGFERSSVLPENCLVLIDQSGQLIAFRIDGQAELSQGEVSVGASTSGTEYTLGHSAARISDQVVPLLESSRLHKLSQGTLRVSDGDLG